MKYLLVDKGYCIYDLISKEQDDVVSKIDQPS